MRALASALVLAVVLAGTAVAREGGAVVEQKDEADRVPGQVVVGFERQAGFSDRRDAREAAGADFLRSALLPRTQLVAVRRGDEQAAAARLEQQPGVRYAEPNYLFHEAAAPTNDTRFGELWGLSNTGQAVDTGPAGTAGVDVNALAAWDTTRGAGQVIAIVDGGVAKDHPDLAPNFWQNPGETANGADDDGNGKVDDVRGFDFVGDNLSSATDADNDPDDYRFHGSHVAGTAAAVADNALGTAGVAHQAQIMAVRVTDGNGTGDNLEIAEGVLYAAREGATVINMSLGGTNFTQALQDAVSEAESRNVVVTVAAMNEGDDVDVTPYYPCALPNANVVCVAAIDNQGNLPSFSNFGAASVDVGAPGVDILSAEPAYEEIYSDGFEDAGDFTAGWAVLGTWARTTAFSIFGDAALIDSPGGDYPNNAGFPNYRATMKAPNVLDLSSQRGCRVAYAVNLNVGGPGDADTFSSGVVVDLIGYRLHQVTQSLGLGVIGHDRSMALADGDSDARLFFMIESNAAGTSDGAIVDGVTVRCRSGAYDGSHYQFLNGTSMASPHVAGVAALVRAAAPHATAGQVADAIKQGVVPTASLAGRTVTGGRVNAAAAIAAAPPPPVVDPGPVVPCAGLSGRKLRKCRVELQVKRKCGKKKGKKKRVCAKRVRAIAKCKAKPRRTAKQRAKRNACLRKAKKIGKKKRKRRS